LGVATIVFLKAPKLHPFGKILAGLGILFIGMNMMSASMAPLRESEAFIGLMTQFSNPLLGILAGALFTAVIQSSSASVGILQALAVAGVIDFKAAVFVLFGQNIGTCITAVLAAIGTNRSAKKTTVIHLLFNLTGTAVFTVLCLTLPVTDWVASLAPDNVTQQIANMHTVFNIATTVMLLPVGQYLARIVDKLLPVKAIDGQALTVTALSEEFRRGGMNFGLTAVHTNLLKQGIDRMIAIASENMQKAYTAVINRDTKILAEIEEAEETLDILNKDIAKYISKILVHNHNRANVSDIERYFMIAGNVERIGDHAVNIADYTKLMKEKSIKFSPLACSEIEEMQKISALALAQAINVEEDKKAWFSKVEDLEEQIDDMTDNYRETHLARMRQGECSEEACILYSELLNDFERIGDHIENIAEAYRKIKNAD
jgi:phosphate:Na+ symporter